MMTVTVNRQELESKVKEMYRQVAENPSGEFHFEMGRNMAERLGYPSADLDNIPREAIESFAGVGYFFHLADLSVGESVVDLGSGSGMDSFLAARKVGSTGRVVGVDMTDAQLAKAERLRLSGGFENLALKKGYIEETACDGESFDCVISNGVINLAVDKRKVFCEVARLLKRGGRLAIADIVTEAPLPEGVVCNATLWAACIGGAGQVDAYRADIEDAGFRVEKLQANPEYQFISDNAKGAARKRGVKSVSILAIKP